MNENEPKLFLVLLGANPPRRNVEQHDYFFGIANSLKELVAPIRAFWPEAGNSIHLDGWREVTNVDGYEIKVIRKNSQVLNNEFKLFFINLGGYQSGKLEEQHYTVLSVKKDRAEAVQNAKKTAFFLTNTIKGAGSHIDEKFGIAIDDIYPIEDILPSVFRNKYDILISPSPDIKEDTIHLGYFKLEKLR